MWRWHHSITTSRLGSVVLSFLKSVIVLPFRFHWTFTRVTGYDLGQGFFLRRGKPRWRKKSVVCRTSSMVRCSHSNEHQKKSSRDLVIVSLSGHLFCLRCANRLLWFSTYISKSAHTSWNFSPTEITNSLVVIRPFENGPLHADNKESGDYFERYII